MRRTSEQQASDDASLYIRWNPDRFSYAIELRLDLVPQIVNELERAERFGMEAGGLFLGSLPDEQTPSLRIEEVAFIPRATDDSATFMVNPAEVGRFAEVRWRAKLEGKVAVGLFRSQIRAGALRPTPIDRTLVEAEFKQPAYALLLIEGKEPHTAAFFLAGDGIFEEEPAVREFRFDEAEFKALPEVSPETASADAEQTPRAKSRLKIFATVAALIVIGICACLLLLALSGRSILPQWIAPANQLDLQISARSQLLRISWNHSAKELADATGGTLSISDGSSNRMIKLGADELRLGAVEYQKTNPQVRVTMTLDTSEGTSPEHTVEWDQK